MTQVELARDWGISPRMIRKLENADTLSPLYWASALNLRLGIVSVPERRRTKSGEPMAVRKKGGGTVRPAPRLPGHIVARVGASVRKGERIRRETFWMPHSATPRAGRDRAAVLAAVQTAIGRAHAAGHNANVTVGFSDANEGAGIAGYDITITSGRGLPKNRYGYSYSAHEGYDLTLSDLDLLADQNDLAYT